MPRDAHGRWIIAKQGLNQKPDKLETIWKDTKGNIISKPSCKCGGNCQCKKN